jgi:DNA repair protein RadC
MARGSNPTSLKPPGVAEAQSLLDLLAPGPHASPAPKPAVHGAEGHRSRMRDRLLTAGPDALADHEMLEMILFLALPRRDTKPIARALLARFGTFSNAIAAPLSDLLHIDGLGEAGAAAIKVVQAASIRLIRASVTEKPVMENWDRLIGYLTAALAHEVVEQVRVLFLDTKNRLIADEMLSQGTIDRAPVYPREVVKRALELHASSLILVHNHPSGDPAPSRDDVVMTQEVRRAADTLGIKLFDHIVIGGHRWISFKAQGLL